MQSVFVSWRASLSNAVSLSFHRDILLADLDIVGKFSSRHGIICIQKHTGAEDSKE